MSFSFLPAFAVLHHFTVTPRLYAASWAGREQREKERIHYVFVNLFLQKKKKKLLSLRFPFVEKAFDEKRRRRDNYR